MSTGVGMSDCCLSGKVHSGTPKGKEEEIGGIPVYVSTPQNGSKEKSVIFIVDSMSMLAHIALRCAISTRLLY